MTTIELSSAHRFKLMLLLACTSTARSRTPGRPRHRMTFGKQTADSAASEVARPPALERSHLGFVHVEGRRCTQWATTCTALKPERLREG